MTPFDKMITNSQELELDSRVLVFIEELVRDIDYGSVTLIVQDGYLVQIEKNERIKLS